MQPDDSGVAARVHRETGDRVGEAIDLSNQGLGWLALGHPARARRDLEAALRLLRANGDRLLERNTLTHLSVLSLSDGHETRAVALARQALDIAKEAKALVNAAIAGLRLGDAELALGRGAEAGLAYRQALETAPGIDDPMQHEASAGLARLAMGNGDTAAALAALQSLLAHVEQGGALNGTDDIRRIELTCHQVLAGAGDARADAWLERPHTTLMAQAAAIGRSGAVGV